MKKKSSPILIINEAINTDVQDPDDDYLDIMQKDKGKKGKKFEKYKPKKSSSKDEEANLEGAESQVKSLLSLFLHTIETEEKKDLDSNRLFLNEIESVKKIQKQNKFETTKKINIYSDRKNSNILHKKDGLNKLDTISSNNQNYIRAHSLQFVKLDKKNAVKRKKTAKKNQDKSNFYKNKRKGNLIKDNIDNNESLNFKSSLDISSNQNNNVNFIKKGITNSHENDDKDNLQTLKSIGINHAPIKKKIKKNTIQKYSTVKNEKIDSETKLKKKLKNSLKISNRKKNSISKDDSKRESILSNDSKTILKKLTECKNEIKIEDQFKDSSLVAKNLEVSNITNSYVNKNKTNSIIRTSNISVNKKDDSGSKSKRSSINSSTNSNRNSLVGNLIKRKSRISSNKGLHGIMRAITSSCAVYKDLFKKDKNKLFRVGTALKSLQERIKQTIILRPEDLVLDFSEGMKPLTKKEKTIVNKEHRNSHLSSQSSLSHLSKKNELDNSKRNSIDINKQENIQDIPIKIENIEKNPEQIYQIDTKELLRNETEEELQENISQSKFIKLHEKYRIFIHRNLVYDSLDDEEIEDEISNYLYFNPNSKFMLMFDTILLIFTLYSLFWIPFYLAHNLNFCKEKKFIFANVINLFTEIINLLDLIFGFFKAYYNFEEQLIKKNSIIAKKYLCDWFIIDMISAIPFYSIFKFREDKCDSLDLSIIYYNNILHNLNYLYMCNRVLKMIKVFFKNQAYNYLLNSYHKKNLFFKLIINLIRMSCLLFVFHFCACLYIFIGRNSYPNWILYTKLEIKAFADIYVCAIYMLITTLTTVGYGDITCYSFQERIFQLFLLIIGIMSYSFAVSSFSNYIQKINEKSIEFEKRKDILDDIKLNNPNLPDKLYDRILRYLKYKNLSEKRDKHIILDCLPVGLKNNLVYEMYKPIIKNFIFFKNFENTDFIVRVILSFRPIIAIKNDILVNEGDIVEEILFVKKGVLYVELPINIKNPYKNVEKYLNMTFLQIEKGPDLEKVGNTTIINSNINNSNILGNTILPGKDVKKKLFETKINNQKTFDETTYVKILNIRENEHFGDVLMFLEKRSPLRVRVRSKKTELFFLKKTDAVKISSIYQNIWKRINKKSVFNFEQIKKSIHKIVEIYCAFSTIKTLIENNENIKKRKIYRETMRISKRKLKLDSQINQIIRSKSEKKIINKKNKFFNNSTIDTNVTRNKSAKKLPSKTLNLYSTSFSDDSDNDDSSDSDESELEEYSYKKNRSNRKQKISNSKLLNAYNGCYKFYKGANNKYNLNVIDTIIDEEPGDEGSITPSKKNEIISFNKVPSKYNWNKTSTIKHDFKRTASLQQEIEKSASLKANIEGNSKSNFDIYSNSIKCIIEKEEFEEEDKIDDNSSNNKKRKKIKEKEIRICEKSKFNKKEIYTSSDSCKKSISNEPNIPSLSSVKNENSNEINNINDISENYLTPFKKEDINEEIYPNEIFNLSKKEENLLSRRINLSNILNELENNPHNFIIKNNDKIQFLLDSNRDTLINNQNDINQIQITDSNIENTNKDFNMHKEENKIKMNSKNCCHCKNHSKTKNSTLSKEKITHTYSIIKITEIEYKSLYENLNQITNYTYFSNVELQNKVKNIITEPSILTISNTNTLLKKNTMSTFNKSPILNSNTGKFVTTINPMTKLKNTCSLYRINSTINKKSNEINNININKKYKNKKKNSSLTKRSETFCDSPELKIMRSTSIDKYEAKKNKFQTGIDNFLNNNTSFTGKFGIKAQKNLINKQEIEKQKINNIEKIKIKKSKGEKTEFPNASGLLGGDIEQKNTMKMNPNFFNKKRKGNLLSQINLNIEKTNQNLNNPEEFYTNYFNSILGRSGDKQILDNKRYKRRGSAICFTNKMIIPTVKSLKSKKKK